MRPDNRWICTHSAASPSTTCRTVRSPAPPIGRNTGSSCLSIRSPATYSSARCLTARGPSGWTISNSSWTACRSPRCRRSRELTILDTDREFPQGSGVEITEFTPEQVEHLAALAEVWGFLKYHHPRIGRGERGGRGPDAGETRRRIQARQQPFQPQSAALLQRRSHRATVRPTHKLLRRPDDPSFAEPGFLVATANSGAKFSSQDNAHQSRTIVPRLIGV